MKVSVLISLYKPNVKFLRELLESVVVSLNACDQSLDYRIRCRFDGENEINRELCLLLDTFNVEIDEIVSGRLGFAGSFLKMIQGCDHTSDLIFLSDQDDVWLSHKVSRTINEYHRCSLPVDLLLSNSLIWTGSETLGHTVPPGYLRFYREFSNKKIYAAIGPAQFFYGHNMVISGSFGGFVSDLLAENKFSIYSHDRFLFYLASLRECGVVVDETPLVLYRQHKSQVIGGTFSGGLFARVQKKTVLLQETSFDLLTILKLLKSSYCVYLDLLVKNIYFFLSRRKK